MRTAEEWRQRAEQFKGSWIANDCLHAAKVIDDGFNPCKRCDGTGNELLSMYRKCQACNGDGISKGNEDGFDD